MPNKPWTKREVNRLLAGKSLFKRSEKSKRRKLIALGLEKPKFKVRSHKKKAWTEAEIKLLKENKNVPNRSKDSIKGMQIRLGLIKVRPDKYKKPWSQEDTDILLKLVQEGKSARDIHNMQILPQHSRNSIQKKMCYMGLSKREVKVILSKSELIKLKRFLQDNWQGKTPEDLVELWNYRLDIKQKINKNKVLYHLTNLKIKIPYYEVAKLNNLKKKENKIKKTTFKSAGLLDENIRLQRAEMMRNRLLSGKDMWTGMKSEECSEFLQEMVKN
jgi:hypothetical protein